MLTLVQVVCLIETAVIAGCLIVAARRRLSPTERKAGGQAQAEADRDDSKREIMRIATAAQTAMIRTVIDGRSRRHP